MFHFYFFIIKTKQNLIAIAFRNFNSIEHFKKKLWINTNSEKESVVFSNYINSIFEWEEKKPELFKMLIGKIFLQMERNDSEKWVAVRYTGSEEYVLESSLWDSEEDEEDEIEEEEENEKENV